MESFNLLLALSCLLLSLTIGCAETLPPSNNHVSGNATKAPTPHVSGANAPGHISGY